MALRAAWILKEDFGIETRVVNMHTLKPLDEKTILVQVADNVKLKFDRTAVTSIVREGEPDTGKS